MALCVKDLKQVLSGLYPTRTKWYNIGLELEVPVETLESIKSENKDDVGACLREMLLCALRSTTPELTWKGIIEALNSVMVEEGQLAKSLEEKHVPKGIHHGGIVYINVLNLCRVVSKPLPTSLGPLCACARGLQ